MPVRLTLPDSSLREFSAPVRGDEIASLLGGTFSLPVIAIKLDGIVQDLASEIDADATVEFVTRESPEALKIIRDCAAHVLARAVQSLFPETKIAIGLPIENGFFYDFLRETPFTSSDLAAIEARMRSIVNEGAPFSKRVLDAKSAKALFVGANDGLKVELLDELADDAEINVYTQQGWCDVCFGAHVPDTTHIGLAFRLIRIAGAFWKGDPKGPVLQRIYGTAWRNEGELDVFLAELKGAALRDHRLIGRDLDLYHLQSDAPGSVYWHPDGWLIHLALEKYLRRQLDAAGYLEVRTPPHYAVAFAGNSGDEDRRCGLSARSDASNQRAAHELTLKPDDCVGHVHLFKRNIVSYRQLPIKMAEFRPCTRDVPSDALHGIARTRRFTLDAAHIFCEPMQVAAEVEHFLQLLLDTYSSLDAGPFRATLVLADEERGKMREATYGFRAALANAGVTYEEACDREANGPRIEIHLRDAKGREWQCGMVRFDHELAGQLGAVYLDRDGHRCAPVLLHQTLLGGFERFMALLIERHAGRLPLWLMPVQVVVATITDDCQAYGERLAAACRDAGIRTTLDLRSETIGFKVRSHRAKNIPVLFAVGRREATTSTVAIRRMRSNKAENASLSDAVAAIAAEVAVPATLLFKGATAGYRILR